MIKDDECIMINEVDSRSSREWQMDDEFVMIYESGSFGSSGWKW